MKQKIRVMTEKVIGEVVAKKYLSILLVIALSLVYYYLGLQALFFWGVFLIFALYELDNRYVGGAAIACLIACPIYLSVKQDAIAEQFAVFAFFFLVITVALQVIELVRHPERFNDSEEKEN